MHQPYFTEFADSIPYPVAFVELDEGPMLMASLHGDLRTFKCDCRVEVYFEHVSAEIGIPRFRLVG